MRTHLWLIVYDIRDDCRRRQVATCLEAHAWRLQYSLFAWVGPRAGCEALARELGELCAPQAGDDVQILRISRHARDHLVQNPRSMDNVSGPLAQWLRAGQPEIAVDAAVQRDEEPPEDSCALVL